MTDIPINPVTRRVQFTGNTGTGPFAFTFNIYVESDIAVYKNDTLLTLTTDYTVAINANGTGSTTLTGTGGGTALILSDVLTIVGARELARTTDFVTAGDLRAVALNEQLDSLVIMVQQLDEKIDRSAKFDQFDVYNDALLPTLNDRKGKYLAFNTTTGNPEAGPDQTDVTALASITSDIALLADIQDGTTATNAITDVAAVAADVDTVAGIAGDVTTVAGNTANISTVAGVSSNVTTVAGISANVTTVAGVSANVTTVAGIAGNVTTVAGDSAEIGTVATDIANVNTVATNIASVNTAASDIAAIIKVADDLNEAISEIETVANNIVVVQTVGTNIANVNTVAGIDANITTVAGISANITTVAGISANVTAVAGDAADIGIVAGLDTEIGTLAGLNTEIVAIYADLPNLNVKVGKTSDTGSAIVPTGTEAQRDGSPSAGYLRFNSEAVSFEGYDGSAWGAIGGGGGGATSDFMYENAATLAENITLAAGRNGMSTGPIDIPSGLSVTIESGSRWVVI